MNVATPISTVIPTLDGPVLAALTGTTDPLSLTDVHRVVGRGSLSGVRRVLLRLESTGLVHVSPGGYVLNRDHIAAASVEQLSQLHGLLADRIRSTIEEWDGSVLLGAIYGSAARRDGDALSDIDLLLVTDGPRLDDLVDTLTENIRRWTGNHAHVVAMTTEDIGRLRTAREPILDEWDRSMIVLVGNRSVLRRGA